MHPAADVLYACDAAWWDCSGPKPGEFAGECWSSHSENKGVNDYKTDAAERHGLTLVAGDKQHGFSLTLGVIHYGDNSGFQAVNLAIQFGASEIWLLGFDMQDTGHFFGEHPDACRKGMTPASWRAHFESAARDMPPGLQIFNATPGSALQCFPRVTL